MFEVARSMTVPFLVVSMALVLVEIFYFRWQGKSCHRLKDTLCNLTILVVGRLSQPLFLGYIYASLKLVEGMRLFQIPDNVGTTILAVVLTDLSYYFEHRWSHKTRLLWFFHEVHHSSKNFNLTTSFRLHWLGRLTAPLIFAPLVLLGFKTEQVVLFFILNLFYQFFLHTRAVGTLGVLEGIINTPSAHRVHHARNKIYVDKNFGGILMIWDRLFGTYQAETEEPQFGILGKFESNNPLVVQFHNLPGYSWLNSLPARARKRVAAVLGVLIVTSGTASFAEPTKMLKGEVHIEGPNATEEASASSSSSFVGLWNANIIGLGRHPAILITAQTGDQVTGTYKGLIGTYPLSGTIDDASGNFRLYVDFADSKMIKLVRIVRHRSNGSAVALIEGHLAGGTISGTGSLPDIGDKVVRFEARKKNAEKSLSAPANEALELGAES